MDTPKTGYFVNPVQAGMRVIDPSNLYKKQEHRVLRSSITLPSQYNAYAVCTEFARDWFLKKFPPNAFNSVYVDGSKSFDQFRMFSKIDQQLKKTNPVLAIQPRIDAQYNRNYIDTNLAIGGYLRRAKMDGTFFSDNRPDKGLHLAIQMKTIKMDFTFKMRVDTTAEQMDLIELIKYKHRAGASENQYTPLDIHVPKPIINQMAFDNSIDFDTEKGPNNPDEMLKYLNSHSLLPFLYKRRNATGTWEYFIRMENCGVYIKSELPNMDEGGTRQDAENMYFVPDFSVSIEMSAPYCYVYYSQSKQEIINTSNQYLKDDAAIILMRSTLGELPDANEAGWNRILTTEYVVDMEDLKKKVAIDFHDLIQGELMRIINYTRSVALNPSLFMDFIVFNEDSYQDYEIDWDHSTLTMKNRVSHPGFLIGIYVDMGYVNNVNIHHNFADGFNSPDSFRLTNRIGKLE